ncbi:YoaK family protein [Deinococcus sp.]|uniref:YoaK family protein n=1 Tax=Deinococcus sp. TaxID=47478 RepID=UPI0025B7CEEC|nr:YoaK family protein [Deinococcus sp.]
MKDNSRLMLAALSLLTVSTGLIDAATVLGSSVFAANMTGNLVFLGFSLGGSSDYSVPSSLAAIFGFLLGAFVAGRLIRDKLTARKAGLALGIQTVFILLGAGLAWLTKAGESDSWGRWLMLILLGVAMGLQNTVSIKKSALDDMKTTVMTLTLAGMAADLGRGKTDKLGVRLFSVLLLVVGAVTGALIYYSAGLVATILATALCVGLTAALFAVGEEEKV